MTSFSSQEKSDPAKLDSSLSVNRNHGSLALERDKSVAQSSAWGPDEESPFSRQRMTILSYLEIPFVYRWLILGATVISMLIGWGVILIWPRSYVSEAKLMIRVGRESVALDPTVTTSQTLMLQKTQEEEVNSALEVLGSRRIVEMVVDELGEDSVLNGTLPLQGGAPSQQAGIRGSLAKYLVSWIDWGISLTGVRDDISDRELAIIRLQNKLSVYAAKKSTVVGVMAESKTPAMAQAIVRSALKSFLSEHLKVSSTEGSHEFFLKQANEVESKLNSLIEQRTLLMQQKKIVSIDDNRALLAGELVTIEAALITSRGELEQTQAEIRDLETKVAAAEDEIVAAKNAQSDITWSGIRQRVYDLELQEKSFASKYTDDDQRLVQVREQLDGAREILDRLQSDRVDESMTPNPAKQRLQEELQRSQTRLVGLNSIIEKRLDQKEEVGRQIDSLHQFELQLMQMDRNIGTLEASLGNLKSKLEESRVLDELQSQRISNVNVFQDATLVERASKPNKKILAGAFTLMGLLCGFGLAYVRELCSSRLRTVEHVEGVTDCQVVANIPAIRDKSRLQRMLRSSSATSGLRQQCKSVLGDVLLTPTLRGVKRGRTLGVMGIEDQCGASTIATALALTAAEEGRIKVTLIDADQQSRTIARLFGLGDTPGLAEILSGETELDACVQQIPSMPLELITCSASNHDPGFESDPKSILHLLDDFQQDSDLVIVDLPPASRLDQAAPIARELEQILLVVESGVSDVDKTRRAVKRIRSSGSLLVGIVLNKTQESMPKWVRKIVS
ncbi:MAG: hypothetical protein KDB03_17780 [Planctomycetales bacterium]|nr:hypothetical protein [Planctomycetales bacterium]